MSQWRQLDKRPTGITVVAILQLISGIVILVIGGWLFSVSSALSVFSGVINIAIGVIYLYVAFGLLKGKGWAWFSMIMVQVIGTPLSIALIFVSPGVSNNGLGAANIPLAVVIVIYMLKPKTRAYFGKAKL
jgi:uncharacterized membrane protein (DUF2068 family)